VTSSPRRASLSTSERHARDDGRPIRLEKVNQHLAKSWNQQLRNQDPSEVQDRVQQTQRELLLREQMKRSRKNWRAGRRRATRKI